LTGYSGLSTVRTALEVLCLSVEVDI
jgi:hypothetical protein